MTHILHDEGFQTLEAAWRGLDMLVHGLDTDTLIHLYILDVSKEKLTADLKGTADVRDSEAYRGAAGPLGADCGQSFVRSGGGSGCRSTGAS